MGGPGSGRHWHLGANDTTNQYRKIDVRHWHRDGLLTPGCAFLSQWTHNDEVVGSVQVYVGTGCVHLSYRHQSGGSEWKDEDYPIWLVWTSCNLGSQRPWFRCPAHGCGRRVAILYGGGIFACRHCYRLAYPCQRETRDDRAMRRADRIREKLGWKPGILNDNGLKPKGMHWRTFERLTAEYNAFVEQSLAEAMLRFGLSPTNDPCPGKTI